MPCDVGYKTYAPIRIPQPKPQVFRKKMPAPKVNQDLLDKLGVDDQLFLDWIVGLDIKPLLEEALKQTLAVSASGSVAFSVTEDGTLVAERTYANNLEKREVENTIDLVAQHWQMEILKIVTQLLNYDAEISIQSVGSGETITLIAEESGKTHPCKYIRISKDSTGNGEIMFEHFADKTSLEKEKVKFAALAQKLGVPVILPDTPIAGKAIRASTETQQQANMRGSK